MGEKGGAILLLVGVVALFVFLVAGKVAPAIDAKGDEVITSVGGTSTTTVE
ncbi:hypothetical protein KM915_20825 [Cytobacillus oceanisediminis]|uniref:hypothetical protein n=1 Tax=Cytobacillus oceanisediminis TaxID=665099 RepID=UPI001C22A4D5|nr:hypothetical protein [Cytobacillus oceanisediminis]MBU8732495.1 hypothetical protein [Cytobacillus oceanisediminis]